jgi:hypothetical protein
VAVGAGHVLCSLVMDRPTCFRHCVWKCAHVCSRMTLQAERIHIADGQQPWIRRTVRRVASRAAFRLDHRMLEDERSGCFRMALSADLIVVGGRLKLFVLECAVRIVTVAASHQALVHFVMERLSKCRLHIGMAGVAELGLRNPKKAGFIRKAMHAVATGAAQSGLAMSGLFEVGVRCCVAAEAGSVDLFCRRLGKLKNLRNVATAIDVKLARSMAAFAGHSLAAMQQGKAGMRVCPKLLNNLAMASLAGFSPNKIGVLGWNWSLRQGALLLAPTGGLYTLGLAAASIENYKKCSR